MRTLVVRAAIYTPILPLWQAKFLLFFQKLRQHAKFPPRTARRCALRGLYAGVVGVIGDNERMRDATHGVNPHRHSAAFRGGMAHVVVPPGFARG